MLIVRDKQVVAMEDEIRRILTSEIYTYAHNKGVPLGFLSDSKIVQESIDAIAGRVASLIGTVRLDKNQLKAVKKFEKEKKFYEEAELKERLKEIRRRKNVKSSKRDKV